MPARPLRSVGAVVAAVAVVVSGCGLFGSDEDGSSPGPTGTELPATSAPVSDVAGPRLVESGASPRTPLRLRLAEGVTVSLTYATDLDLEAEAEGSTRTLDAPPVDQTVNFVVGAPGPDGFAVSFRVTAMTVQEGSPGLTTEEALLLDAALAPIVGLAGSGTLSDRGRFTDLTLTVPPGVDAAVADQIEALEAQITGLTPTLPTEPVGVGGSWASDTTATVGGARIRQTTTYTVTAIDGDLVTYSSSSTFTGEPQDLPLSGLPDGTTARLVSSSLTGEASGTLDLRSPAHALLASTSGTQVVEVTAPGGEPQRSSQRIELTSSVRAAT